MARPVGVRPRTYGPSHRKCRLHLCWRGWKSGTSLPRILQPGPTFCTFPASGSRARATSDDRAGQLAMCRLTTRSMNRRAGRIPGSPRASTANRRSANQSSFRAFHHRFRLRARPAAVLCMEDGDEVDGSNIGLVLGPFRGVRCPSLAFSASLSMQAWASGSARRLTSARATSGVRMRLTGSRRRSRTGAWVLMAGVYRNSDPRQSKEIEVMVQGPTRELGVSRRLTWPASFPPSVPAWVA